jgi:GTP-binding protein Era
MVEIGEQELKDEAFFNKIIHAKILLLLLNKIDNSNQLEEQVAFFGQPKCREIFPISALQNFNVPEVLVELLSYCQNRQRIIQKIN